MRIIESAPQIQPKAFRQMEMHAISGGNKEVCGLVFKDRYVRMRNVSDDPARFAADPAQLARVLARFGEPEAVFHVHPGGNLVLSEYDKKKWYYIYSTMIIGSLRSGTFRWKEYRLKVANTE